MKGIRRDVPKEVMSTIGETIITKLVTVFVELRCPGCKKGRMVWTGHGNTAGMAPTEWRHRRSGCYRVMDFTETFPRVEYRNAKGDVVGYGMTA